MPNSWPSKVFIGNCGKVSLLKEKMAKVQKEKHNWRTQLTAAHSGYLSEDYSFLLSWVYQKKLLRNLWLQNIRET
jgi:hypothetical protein